MCRWITLVGEGILALGCGSHKEGFEIGTTFIVGILGDEVDEGRIIHCGDPLGCTRHTDLGENDLDFDGGQTVEEQFNAPEHIVMLGQVDETSEEVGSLLLQLDSRQDEAQELNIGMRILVDEETVRSRRQGQSRQDPIDENFAWNIFQQLLISSELVEITFVLGSRDIGVPP